jgi:hypothetical protein
MADFIPGKGAGNVSPGRQTSVWRHICSVKYHRDFNPLSPCAHFVALVPIIQPRARERHRLGAAVMVLSRLRRGRVFVAESGSADPSRRRWPLRQLSQSFGAGAPENRSAIQAIAAGALS